MKYKRHIVVVGGGLMGVTSAYALAVKGNKVTVLEENDELGHGASFANGGMLTPSMPDPWNSPGVGGYLFQSLFNPSSSLLLRPKVIPSHIPWGLRFLKNSTRLRYEKATRVNYDLAEYSMKKTNAWSDALNLQYESSDCGTLKVFRSVSNLQAALKVAISLKRRGLVFESLNQKATLVREPSLQPVKGQIVGSIFYPNDSVGNAFLFLRELSERAKYMDVDFRCGSSVNSFDVHNNSVQGLKVGTDYLKADGVLICAGYKSPALAKLLGLSLSIKPAKGYSITFRAPNLKSLRHGIIDDALHAAIVPIGENLRVVGTAEFAGEDFNLSANRIQNLINFYNKILPEYAKSLDENSVKKWAGLRPMSADGVPIISDTPVNGVYINAGHCHLGWTMAAGSAELISDIISNSKTEIDTSPYAYGR